MSAVVTWKRFSHYSPAMIEGHWSPMAISQLTPVTCCFGVLLTVNMDMVLKTVEWSVICHATTSMWRHRNDVEKDRLPVLKLIDKLMQ